MIAFGGPGRPASAAAHPYAVYHRSHNDLTPLRGYRGLIDFALLSMPPRMMVFAMALFLPAGTLAWPAGRAFFLLMFGFAIAMSLWLLRFNPDLLAERLTGIGRPDQKTWDKVFLALTGVAFFAWLAVMALDAVRFRWSQVPP